MIDKDDLTLIAHCIAVANNHSAPEDYVKLVVDAGFPFNSAAAFPIIQAPELTVNEVLINAAVRTEFEALRIAPDEFTVEELLNGEKSGVTTPLIQVY